MIKVLKQGLNHAIDMDRINSNSTIIDAGAGRGQFVKTIREMVNCKIICVECSKLNIQEIKSGQYENLVLIEGALSGVHGDKVTYTEFYGDSSRGTGGYFEWGNIYGNHKQFLSQRGDGVGMNEYLVDCVSLSNIMDDHCPSGVDYLKMDIEGAEYEVFMSTSDRHLCSIGQLSIELHDKGKNSTLIDRLKSLGFAHSEFDNNEHYFSRQN